MSTRGSASPANRYLTADSWPTQLRLEWERAKKGVESPFREDGGGRRPKPVSLAKYQSGLERYLGFLERQRQLPSHGSFAALITPEHLDQYFGHLRACGNADYTIVGRFEELRAAFQLLMPEKQLGWITRPGGISIRRLLPMKRRNVFWPDSAELLTWAEELFEKGCGLTSPRHRCAMVRDAVVIGMLATFAPRRRTLASLRISRHLNRRGAEWFVALDDAIMKEENAYGLPLAREVAVMLDRYLDTERRELLKTISNQFIPRLTMNDYLWLTWNGGAMSPLEISGMVQVRTKERFGVAFGPHRFRTSLNTKLAQETPEASQDGAAILGNGPQTALRSYNRASGIAAGRRHSQHLAQLRQESAAARRQ